MTQTGTTFTVKYLSSKMPSLSIAFRDGNIITGDTEHLSIYFKSKASFLGYYISKLCISPKTANIVPSVKTGHPRAAIYCSQDIELHKINELKHRDMAIALTKLDGK